ncbi:arginase family protein [Rhizobium yanglingense]
MDRPGPLHPDRHPHPRAGGFRHSHPLRPSGRGNECRLRSPTAIVSHTEDAAAYLTFDIDCLDPAYAPGTGTPVAGGPSSAKILSVSAAPAARSISAAQTWSRSRRPYDHADITAIAGGDGRDVYARAPRREATQRRR